MQLYWALRDSTKAATLTQNVTGPIGPVTQKIYWSYKKCIGLQIFF